MQTFLPYENFFQSAQCLDRQRLGKQRVETMQIMQTLAGIKNGWKNHPAVKMWSGHEDYLMIYQLAIVDEWLKRGYKDSCFEKTAKALSEIDHVSTRPSWLGNKEFHLSHQSNLLRKNYEHYSQFKWQVSDDLAYIWPV